MSRIITTRTEIKDKALAVLACQQAGVAFRDEGEVLVFTSGSLANSQLNLRTGDIVGDSDFGHSKTSLGMLRQYYSEAKFKAEAQKIGTVIDERTTNKEGEIVLMWHMA